MKICEGIQAIDLALYLEKEKALVISDIHLGYEESLAKKGVLVPRTQYKQTIKRLDYIFSKLPKIRKVILNGDIKHEFGTVSTQEWREVLRLLDYLQKKGEVIAVKGNHDTILGPIAKKRKVEEVREYRTGNILIAHGDYVPEKLSEIIIIGHEHPAITLREGAKTEKYKCYLKGKYKKSTLIVQPSFNLLTRGTDITKEKPISPLLKKANDFKCYIVNDETHEVLDFGQIKELVPARVSPDGHSRSE